MFSIPHEFIDTVLASNGEDGRRWLAGLHPLVENLCNRWQLILDGPAMHGYLGLVLPVMQGERPAVVKISWMSDVTRHEAAVLSLWNGRGAVMLLAHDQDSGAMLLERLDHTRSLNELDIGEAVAVSGRLLRRLALPDPGGLPLLLDAAAEIAQSLQSRWERQGRPFSQRILDRTHDLALQLGPATGKLLVNYDIHYDNVLAGTREPWLVVDPKPIIGDLEYGIAQILWNRLEDILAANGLDYAFDLLVETAELDHHLARRWTLVRCVDYWLWALSAGLTIDPLRCTYVVNWLMPHLSATMPGEK